MNRARIRVLNWTLVGLGIAILALGATIAVTISSTGAFPGPWFGRGGPGFHAWEGLGQGPGFEPGFRGMWPGMHMAGGLVLLAVIALLALAFFRRRFHRPVELGGHGREEDAMGLLRVEFAEGKISEDEYRGRLAALHETRRI